MYRIYVVGLFLMSIFLGSVLAAVGVPPAAAFPIGFVLAGAGATFMERRTNRPVPILGPVLIGMGFLFGIGGVVDALPQINGWVVGLSTLALEIVATIGAIRLYRRVGRRAATAQRRRLAERHGWRFEEQAAVPVPGPVSAAQFVGVPNEAASTTGYDVLYLDADGYPVTVFDRLRPQERDPRRRTVWMVQLPVSLPVVLSSFAGYLDVEGRLRQAQAPASAPAPPAGADTG